MSETLAPRLKAAGILYLSGSQVLLVQRSELSDHPGTWCIPGGKLEDGETPQQAAIREFNEEVGPSPIGEKDLKFLGFDTQTGVDFTTFLVMGPVFTPTLNDEHTDSMWCELDQLPTNIHPGLFPVLEALPGNMARMQPKTELEAARGILEGWLKSPYMYENISLVDLRITGTGQAYRGAKKEHVYRRPELYLTNDFLARCSGLPVVWEHPETPKLDTKSFAARIVGTILLPYIKGNEVWGVAKIYDAEAAEELASELLSTSPGVFFRDMTVNEKVPLEDGHHLLIEGVPSLLDHVAICRVGVWDKGGAPSGVVSEHRGDSASMTEDEKVAKDALDAAAAEKDRKDAEAKAEKEAQDKKDADEKAEKDRKDADEGTKLDKLLTGLDSLNARMDAWEGKGKSDSDKEEEAKKAAAEKEAKDKKDADEKAAKDQEEMDKKDSDEKAALKAELKLLRDRLPADPSDEDASAMSDAQARADSVMTAHGKRAPRPLLGETVLGYRRRVLGMLKTHSPTWKDADVSKMDDGVLAIAEGQAYKDSLAAAHSPTDLAAGDLRQVVKEDPTTGRRITEFFGDPAATWAPFKTASRRLDRPLFSGNRADARSRA